MPAICANSILKNCVGKTKVYATLLKGLRSWCGKTVSRPMNCCLSQGLSNSNQPRKVGK
ncbi:Uncharacterised protein [Vibrio cholerae]|nr:Uncharacterised protein [Vibrio cholerae]